MITPEDFQKVDIRVGKIIKVEHLKDGKYSSHKLTIDFGPEIGHKKTCARVIKYTDEQLMERLIVAVINFPPKQIGQNMSEVLILGLPDEEGECVLLSPDKNVPLGGKLF